MFAATILKEELERLGVTIKGKISRGKTPENAMVLTQHDSRSLAEALIDFTKVSNNVAHDTLVKAIAAESGVMPATSQAGLKRIVEFLKSNVGVEANELVAADGAGLSRYNLITPNQMVKLLDYSANHFHMGAEFMAALSFGGEDGLIRSRLTADAVRGQVRAKSGTMSGLSSLVGYLTDNKGERYAFAIMINNFVGSVAPYVALQDRILTSLLTTSDVAVTKVK
jgi:D-alanyl-D-alanine carboxypeptidase/D-alanyl-D-alanine-endopeptidase (penicillin-binding protein 4)